jgi:hypothetical protein
MAERNQRQSGAGVGIMLAAAAAAAAGAYFLYGKDGPKNRAKVRGWALKLRGEVLERMEQMKEMNEDVYLRIIDTVKNRYERLKDVDSEELAATIRDLRSHWKHIKAQMAAPVRPAANKKRSSRTKTSSKQSPPKSS